MGHSRSDKAASHERILQVAARLFRERGFDAVSIADVMSEAGLTHGGFYKHFATREALLSEAMVFAFADSGARLADALSLSGGPNLESLLEAYLDAAYVRDPGRGCPVAALAGDVGRDPSARETFQVLFGSYVDWLSDMLDGPVEGRRARAAAIASAMAGAMAVSRALGDDPLAGEVLAGARQLILRSEPTGPPRR